MYLVANYTLRIIFFILLALIFSREGIAEYEDCSKQLISIAMIANRVRPTEFSINQRIYDHVKNLSQNLFSETYQAIKNGQEKQIYLTDMKIWPPVTAADCDGDNDLPSKGRGSNIAHRDIWDYYYRNRRIHCETTHSAVEDILIIFEYDAYLGHPNAAEITINTLKKQKEDLLYLGYCYKKKQHHPKYNKLAPFCLHAYSITIPTGSAKLLQLLDSCGPFADAQLYNFANNGNITWSYIDIEYDRSYVDHLFNEYGIHMSGSFEYSGIYIQAKYDDLIASHSFHDGVFAHNRLHPRQIYCLWKGKWRPIANMNDYLLLNPTMSNVMQLSPYQMKRYLKDDKVLSSDEVQEIVAMLKEKQRKSH